MITNIAKAAIKALTGKIPFGGAALNGTIAAVIVEALGQAVIAAAEAMAKGQLDPEKIDSVVDFVSNNVKKNKYVGSAITFIETNAEKLNGKSSKDVFKEIKKTVYTEGKQ